MINVVGCCNVVYLDILSDAIVVNVVVEILQYLVACDIGRPFLRIRKSREFHDLLWNVHPGER